MPEEVRSLLDVGEQQAALEALRHAGVEADVGRAIDAIEGKTDDYCSPELAQALYERKPGEKEIRWLDASQHIDFYDSQAHVTAAARAAAGFLRRTLG